jgi:hypothetical protein
VTQFDFFNTVPQNFTLSAPGAGGGNMSLSYAVIGVDQLQYAAVIQTNNFTLAAPTQMTMRCNPGPYLSNTRITTCTVTPGSVPQYKQLTVLLTKFGVGTGIFSVPQLFFSTALSQNFTFQANSPGPITIVATPSNIDGSQFLPPPPITLQLTNCTVLVTCDPVSSPSGLSSSLRFNQNSTCSVLPNCPPPTGSFTVLISLTGAGVVFPTSLTFFTNVSQTFVYTAPLVTAFPVISFPMAGLDSGAYVQAGMVQWNVDKGQCACKPVELSDGNCRVLECGACVSPVFLCCYSCSPSFSCVFHLDLCAVQPSSVHLLRPFHSHWLSSW